MILDGHLLVISTAVVPAALSTPATPPRVHADPPSLSWKGFLFAHSVQYQGIPRCYAITPDRVINCCQLCYHTGPLIPYTMALIMYV